MVRSGRDGACGSTSTAEWRFTRAIDGETSENIQGATRSRREHVGDMPLSLSKIFEELVALY
jgi:hypothetical protein